MIYGLYQSAAGIMSNSYRQDVIANNLANSETTGFKRDVTNFRQRFTAAQEMRKVGDGWSDSPYEGLGGGLLAMPNEVDFAQGALRETSAPSDLAIQGQGYFAVKQGDKTLLTRDGRFSVNQSGNLILTSGQAVLDTAGQPITVGTDGPLQIDSDGQITQNGRQLAKIGVFNVDNQASLTKVGGNLFAASDDHPMQAIDATVRSGFVEDSNVEPTTEMADMMDVQRQIQANANMIQTQDSTLQRLVNDVGKIS
jgi:flagellar basal-body rod protein FlgF